MLVRLKTLLYLCLISASLKICGINSLCGHIEIICKGTSCVNYCLFIVYLFPILSQTNPPHFYMYIFQFSSVQLLSCVQLFATPWITARQASPSITNSQNSLKLMSIELVMDSMPSSHLILCRPLYLLPPIPPSIRVFSNEPTLRMRWPKYWNFSFSIIPSKEIPGLISFRMDWLDLLAVQCIYLSLIILPGLSPSPVVLMFTFHTQFFLHCLCLILFFI